MKTSKKAFIMESISENINAVKNQLGNSSDLQERELVLPSLNTKVHLIYIEGINDSTKIEDFILSPLADLSVSQLQPIDSILEFLRLQVIQSIIIKTAKGIDTVIQMLLDGKTAIFVEGETTCLLADTAKWPERSAPEPKAQRTSTGPNIAFNESGTYNLSLIRKTIKNPLLRVEKVQNPNIQTSISLVFIEGEVDKEILSEVRKKIDAINIPVLLDVNYLEESLIDNTTSLFPLTISSDRPDVVCAEVLSGKIAIVIDGTQFVLTLPSVFIQFFQSPDDYYTLNRSIQTKRVGRLFFFLLAILLPSLYISFTLYHPGLIPTSLLIGLVAQREIVPFPTIVEVFVFLWLIVIITEGSQRLPSGVVLTVAIFSSIILGQQAVEAQLVQPATLVVLAASYVMSSVVPIYSLSVAYKRLTFRFVFLAALLGLYGILIGLIVLLLHLCSLRSFGVPYLSPLAPFQPQDQKDAVFRLPIQHIISNDKSVFKEDPMRKK
ncbi:spore germination protein [Sutcliffiella horikoshii]|uniref:Spore germination protein n=1 Tax=Sutcliffiella horikoshii TaxID=79883 RepID=A0A5D4SWR9_9BACI|nr:spore germination protein [Sutcliffiella horikoshii]TYS67419.1 spore germination protein [Sutcliffiella horikoshii]